MIGEKIELSWHKIAHFSLRTCYETQYKCRNTGAYKIVEVGRDSNGFPTQRQKTTFYVDSVSKKKIKSEEELINELNKTDKP